MIETFEIVDEPKIKSIAKDYPNAIDGENFLKTLVSETFPFGFKNTPDEISLLKILYLKNENDFDAKKISPFYFAHEDDIENIKGILDGAEYDGEAYLLRVKTKKENIDVEETLRINLLYQFEYSTVLKPNSELSIIKIEKL